MTATLRAVPLPSGVPELAALDLLRTVVSTGSVSKAAELHGITQPSASSRIRTLERQLGVTVLDRSPTGSRPTPDGLLVAKWAEDVLGSAESLAHGVASLRAERRGLLRVASSYTIAEHLLPPWLTAFLADRDGDSVSLDVVNSRIVIERVVTGAVDLGFVESPAVPDSVGSSVAAVDELVPVVAPTHSWAGVEQVDLATFASTPLVLRERGSGTRDALERAIGAAGHALTDSALDLGSLSATRIAAINGSAPTVISRLAVADDLASGRLVTVTVPGLSMPRELRAVWSLDRDLSRLAAGLLVWLTNR